MIRNCAVINDLSGMGRCSLVADLSVLSAMGIQACPAPTAILSAQTGYPAYSMLDMAGRLREYLDKWKDIGASFDGILTGYLTGAEEGGIVLDFLRQRRQEAGVVLVDPVMGDGGRAFGHYSGELCAQMRAMARLADIVTPNVTELLLLAGRAPDLSLSEDEIASEARSLICREGQSYVVTGLSEGNSIGNLIVTSSKVRLLTFRRFGQSFSGTGDLLASAVFGGVLRGDRLEDSVERAGMFIEAGAKQSAERACPRNEGIDYERFLSMLAPKR